MRKWIIIDNCVTSNRSTMFWRRDVNFWVIQCINLVSKHNFYSISRFLGNNLERKTLELQIRFEKHTHRKQKWIQKYSSTAHRMCNNRHGNNRSKLCNLLEKKQNKKSLLFIKAHISFAMKLFKYFIKSQKLRNFSYSKVKVYCDWPSSVLFMFWKEVLSLLEYFQIKVISFDCQNQQFPRWSCTVPYINLSKTTFFLSFFRRENEISI